MLETDEISFQAFSAPLIGLPVTHVWRGYGSAIFLEFGDLRMRKRLDGSPGNPKGKMGLMIEWSWRIEGKRRIWCGSWSDEDRWDRYLQKLLHATVLEVKLFGRLPEINIAFSNGIHLLSMMTAEGDPEWALFDRRTDITKSVGVKAGRLHFESGH